MRSILTTFIILFVLNASNSFACKFCEQAAAQYAAQNPQQTASASPTTGSQKPQQQVAFIGKGAPKQTDSFIPNYFNYIDNVGKEEAPSERRKEVPSVYINSGDSQ